MQAVLADGTGDENFTKAPVKVVMPENKEEPKPKKLTQSASAVGSIIFALGFNILLFIVAPLVLTNLLFIGLGWAEAPVVAAGAGWGETGKPYVLKISLPSFGTGVSVNLIDGLVWRWVVI